MVKPVKHVTQWMVIADRLWGQACDEQGKVVDERVIRTSKVVGLTASVCESRNTIYILHVPYHDTDRLTRMVVSYGMAPANTMTATAVADAMLETSRAWMILNLIRKYGDARVDANHWHSTMDNPNHPSVVSNRARAAELLEEIGRALGAKSIGPAQGENHG